MDRPKRITPSILLALAMTLLPSLGFSQPETNKIQKLEDFGFSNQILTPAPHPLYEVELNAAIYSNSAFGTLRDLRVFNADNHSIPYELSRWRAAPAAADSARPLSLFPIESSHIDDLGEQAIEVSHTQAGQIKTVRVTSSKSRASSKQTATETTSKIVAYLIDLRSQNEPISKIDLNGISADHNSLVQLTVQSSDNLKDWNTLVRAAPLMMLEYRGETLNQTLIDLPLTRAKYLKIFSESGEPFKLNSLIGHFRPALTSVYSPNLTSIKGQASSTDPHVYRFDTGGYFPIKSVRIMLPETNSLIHFSLDSRASVKDEWTRRSSGRAYRLMVDSKDLHSNAEEIPMTTDRFWQISVLGQETSLSAAPQLEIGWEADRIVFLASGQAPYRLVYGNASVPKTDFGRSLGADLSIISTKSKPLTAALGEQVIIGGPSKLIAPSDVDPFPWRKWLLWAVLGVTIVVIGRMALSLSREISKQ